jgi:hypothetical protein
MHQRLFAPLAAAIIVTPALAGVTGGSNTIDLMQTGSGYIDLDNPGQDSFEDLTSIINPPVGSFLFLGGVIPGVESFYGELGFESINESVARFEFRNEIEVVPFALPDYEWAFSGNRLVFTTVVPVEIFLLGNLSVAGAGLGFLEVYGDDSPALVNPFGGEWGVFLTLGAGTHTIAWGAMSGPSGGSADFEGSVTLTLVPAPGAVALLAAAGLVLTRRRRG